MKELKGFRRRFWLTGFTNYRFAIPLFCDFRGRAIYNDTDQVYLRDPAELFDQPMDGAGFLSINDRDTSVMLIDCERMAQAWHEKAVYAQSRKQLEASARAGKLWGPMADIWNARDKEYVPGASACVHFTTLHTQPWRPFPDQFVYFSNPTNPLWPDLEREADTAGFMPVSATRPSRDWPETALELSSRPDGTELLALLGPQQTPPSPAGAKQPLSGVLERIPDADIPWVLERLFSAYHNLTVRLREPVVPRRGRLRRSRHFWLQQFERAAARHPGTYWQLTRGREVIYGGPLPEGPIQVLTHGKPGHNHQALALARKLAEISGRKLVVTPLPWSPATLILRRLLLFNPPRTLRTDAALLVAAGWMPTRIARWLAKAARRRDVRLVLMGRKAGRAPDHGGISVACRHFDLPEHPNRIDTLLPLNAGTQAQQTPDPAPWQSWLGEAGRPRIAVLVGGDSRSHRFSAEQASQLAAAASGWARQQGAALLVVTSRRSQPRLEALRQNLDDSALLYAWQAGDEHNPYRLALQHADALLVTGESESMLADAVHSGKPVFIWPLPDREPGPWRKLCDAVARKATSPRFNRRGSIRPQQGFTYLCARMLERQWVLPRRNLGALHRHLVGAGLAQWFKPEAPPANRLLQNPSPASRPNELSETAEIIARRIGLPPATATRCDSKERASDE